MNTINKAKMHNKYNCPTPKQNYNWSPTALVKNLSISILNPIYSLHLIIWPDNLQVGKTLVSNKIYQSILPIYEQQRQGMELKLHQMQRQHKWSEQ